MSILGITASDFYSLDPKEFYYALKVATEERRAKSREMYEVARLQTVWLINSSPYVKNKLKKVTDLAVFSWEKEHKLDTGDMQKMVRMVAIAAKAKVVNRSPDDPPTGWAEKQKKKK